MTSQEHADHQLAGFHAAKAGVPFSHHESDAWREGFLLVRPTAAQACNTAAAAMDAALTAMLPKLAKSRYPLKPRPSPEQYVGFVRDIAQALRGF